MGISVEPPGPAIIPAGTGAGASQVQQTPSSPVSATAAVNTAVAVTITGVAGQTIKITGLAVSYNAAPTGGLLTVVVNAVTILALDISAAGPTAPPLPAGGIICQAGQSAVITLAAAGAAVAGRVNVATQQGAP